MSLTGLGHVLLAIDVSTSAKRLFGPICREVERSLLRIRQSGPYDITTYLFHRRVMPFPCEQFRGPHPCDVAVLPTVDDLRNRVGPGTSVLDALFQMLVDASHSTAPRRHILVLTDGWERTSHRHIREVRQRIDSLGPETKVHLRGFAVGKTRTRLADLAQQLQLIRTSFAEPEGNGLGFFSRIDPSAVTEVIRYINRPNCN